MKKHVLAAVLLAVVGGTAHAQTSMPTTPPQPASAQPSLPQPMKGSSDDFLKTMGGPDTGLQPKPSAKSRARHRQARHDQARRDHARRDATFAMGHVERPALAGVALGGPLPRPGQPPHLTTPTPAYPLEDVVTAYTTPLPPVVCHPAPRDPDLPDPRLYKERGLACQSDNP